VKKGCGKAIYRKGKEEKLVCSCGQAVCFKCREEWHPGKTCKEMLETTFNKIAKKMPMKPCPKCNMMIEKNMGCNHMTCKHCTYQFCWLCLGEYKPSHFDEDGPCPGKLFYTPTICDSCACWNNRLCRACGRSLKKFF